MTAQEAARRLACVINTVRRNLKAGRLQGTVVHDEKSNRARQYVLVDSVLKFKPPPVGRKKGSKDKTTDRTARRNAAKINGQLGGLAAAGVPKKRLSKKKM